MLKKQMIIFLAILLLVFMQASAQEMVVEEVAAQMGTNSIAYPQLSGMEDAAVQQKINDEIVTRSGVTNHMVSLFTLTGQQRLNVTYKAYLNENIFSVVISAKGKLPGMRDGHQYTALTYDLSTGEQMTLDSLFSDPDAAVAWMEEQAAASLSEELNGYMEYSDILPLPADSFTLDEDGITFWYPAQQFSLLSGYSGACQFWYEELEAFFKEPLPGITSPAEQKAAIEESVASGVIPHVPVQMGESMSSAADAFRLLRMPDEFPGGRYFIMEDPALRGILIISDSMETGYEASVVEGIQLRRGGLHGLMIGQAQQQEWRQVLGMPDATVAMTGSMAFDYGLCEGSYDVYHYGKHELRMYADAEGVLYAIQLCK